ncbi:Rad2 nuclease [Desmophyllum pertusum]|uniref:Exonuclease 1 n=1 Tax=Desmophyllum pertusum TaxID=174260 RepID=A0A9W9YG72_9CNID|nr:Rad2 nuclease [Desmophyllum pertusum]
MGIHGLLPFLKKYSRKVNFREFSGQTAAIDASCWLHKGLCVSLAQSGRRDWCGAIFRNFLRSVKEAGVTPFVVFDGLPLPAKASVSERRRRERENHLRRAEETNISSEEANKLRSQAAEITFDDITKCINICLAENVNYIVSMYEIGRSDCFPPVKGVMVKASRNGDGEVFNLNEILEGLKTKYGTVPTNVYCCWVRLPKKCEGIGINRAFAMASSGGDMLEALANKGADDEYQENFNKAMAVFHHQTVFDLASCCTAPLTKWDTDPPMDIQYLCGYNLECSFANEVAVGNVNTKTQNKVNSYALFTQRHHKNWTRWSCGHLQHTLETTSDAMASKYVPLDLPVSKSKDLGEGRIIYSFKKDDHAKLLLKSQKGIPSPTKINDQEGRPLKKDGTLDQRFKVNKGKEATAKPSSQKPSKVSHGETAPSSGPVKKDGSPDMRFTVNKKPSPVAKTPSSGSVASPVKRDGTPDMRYAVNKQSSSLVASSQTSSRARSSYTTGPVKKDGDTRHELSSYSSPSGPVKRDGTPDMRYAANKSSYSSPALSSGYYSGGSSYSSGSSSSGRASSGGPMKSDGTPDMRYAANKSSYGGSYSPGYSSGGGSSCSSRSSSGGGSYGSSSSGPMKSDGTPDMRFSANRR